MAGGHALDRNCVRRNTSPRPQIAWLLVRDCTEPPQSLSPSRGRRRPRTSPEACLTHHQDTKLHLPAPARGRRAARVQMTRWRPAGPRPRRETVFGVEREAEKASGTSYQPLVGRALRRPITARQAQPHTQAIRLSHTGELLAKCGEGWGKLFRSAALPRCPAKLLAFVVGTCCPTLAHRERKGNGTGR